MDKSSTSDPSSAGTVTRSRRGFLRRVTRFVRRRVLSVANLPATIAICIVLLCTYYAEVQNHDYFVWSSRVDAEGEVRLVRSRLESYLNSNIQLMRGMVAVIATEPDIDSAEFMALSGKLFEGQHQLLSLGAAPDMVVTMVYPLADNKRAIGLDYREHDAQREAVLRAKTTREMVLSGPVDLVQGGKALIARFPIYTVATESRNSAFWGILSAVIDTDALLRISGVANHPSLDLALSGADASGTDGPLFFGPEQVLSSDPVQAVVHLPSGNWQLSAVPKGGWPQVPGNQWTIRIFGLVAAVLLCGPLLIAGWLHTERREHIVELKHNQKRMAQLSRRLGVALTASKIGVWELKVATQELEWDERMRELYEISPDARVGHEEWVARLHPEDAKRAAGEFDGALQRSDFYDSKFRLLLPSGVVRTIHSMGMIDVAPGGSRRIVGVNVDISKEVALNVRLRDMIAQSEARNNDLESAKAKIEFNALHDSLTGLPNRRYLDDVLSGRGHVRLDRQQPYGLLHIDLDRFKQINDTLGHAAGDAMLVHTAKVLLDNVRTGDFVARIGGDEFVILAKTSTDMKALETMAARIVSRMHEPAYFEGRECRFGVSVGIASSATSPDNPQQVLVNADVALYRAKAAGRNGYQFYSEQLHRAAINTKKLADEISTALEKKQFTAFYQGQFDASTLDLVGVEALARWQHPDRGLLSPDAFLEVAEDLNVVPLIDHMILDCALSQMKTWRRSGLEVPRVSVNVSSRRLHDPDLIHHLKRLKFEPGTLVFELVESIFLDSRTETVNRNIEQIKALGIEIEVDDFGTGYSSIVSLMQLRPARLKIDRQLILPIVESAGQRDMVRSIVNIGASLGIASVGEGVETFEHARLARMLGCTVLQGFGLARPMDGTRFTQFIRKGAWRNAA